MSEGERVALIGLISALLGGSVMWFIALRKMPREMRVLDSQESANLSQALNDAVEALTNSLAVSKGFEARINELEAHRTERGRQIYTLERTIEELNGKIELLNREHAQQVGALQERVNDLERQITNEQQRSSQYKDIIGRLIEALQKVDPTLLEGIDLTDTLRKMKAIGK